MICFRRNKILKGYKYIAPLGLFFVAGGNYAIDILLLWSIYLKLQGCKKENHFF